MLQVVEDSKKGKRIRFQVKTLILAATKLVPLFFPFPKEGTKYIITEESVCRTELKSHK